MSVAAATNALATVANVKYVWGRGQTDTSHDDRIQTLVNLISGRIAEYCDAVFIKSTYTAEFYDGDGNKTLILRHRPVVAASITKITVEDVDESADDITDLATNVSGAALKADYEAGIITRGNRWPRGTQNIKITYQAGYVAASIPKDLEAVCIEWVILLLEGRMKDANVKGADVPSDPLVMFANRLSMFRRPGVA